jgi:hypothetical protein
VSAVYCPPRHNVKKEQFNDLFQNLGPKFIAGGDFNSKHTVWGAHLTTTKGCELAKVLQENNYIFWSTGSPTYWPSDSEKIPDLLDFFISGCISKSYMEVNSNFDLSSDHTPVIKQSVIQ